MPIPDPSTFIGNECGIRLKSGRTVYRMIVKIDTDGVLAQEDGGGTRLYGFSQIDQMWLKEGAAQ